MVLYCDLHGHSRKHNVFMYGNNTATDDLDNVNNISNGGTNNGNGVVGARAFLNERLFPWLMAQKVGDLVMIRIVTDGRGGRGGVEI